MSSSISPDRFMPVEFDQAAFETSYPSPNDLAYKQHLYHALFDKNLCDPKEYRVVHYSRTDKKPLVPIRYQQDPFVYKLPNFEPSFRLDAPGYPSDPERHVMDIKDRKIVISCGGPVYLWDKTVKLIFDPKGKEPYTVRWLQNDQCMASFKNRVQIWDVETTQRIRNIRTAHRTETVLASQPQTGSIAFAGSDEGSIEQYDFRMERPSVWQSNGLHNQQVLEILSNSHSIVSSGKDGNIFVSDARAAPTRPTIRYSKHTEPVVALCMRPSNPVIATADKTIHFWDMRTAETKQTIETDEKVSRMIWSQDHLLTATGSEMEFFSEFASQKYAKIGSHKCHEGSISEMVFDHNQTVATVESDKDLKIWELYPPKPKKRSCSALEEGIYSGIR